MATEDLNEQGVNLQKWGCRYRKSIESGVEISTRIRTSYSRARSVTSKALLGMTCFIQLRHVNFHIIHSFVTILNINADKRERHRVVLANRFTTTYDPESELEMHDPSIAGISP